jgi:hypothetical protein
MTAGFLDLAALRYLRKKPPAAHPKPVETLTLIGQCVLYASAPAANPDGTLLLPSPRAAEFVGTGIFNSGSEAAFVRKETPPPPVNTALNVSVPWLKAFIANR